MIKNMNDKKGNSIHISSKCIVRVMITIMITTTIIKRANMIMISKLITISVNLYCIKAFMIITAYIKEQYSATDT